MEKENLYKLDENGRTRFWRAEINGSAYRFHSGILEGRTVTSEWTQASSKNGGRTNGTSPEQQAILEVEAHYRKRLKRGYTRNIKAIKIVKEDLIRPMLAHRYEDNIDKIQFPVYAQPKLDGIRCIIRGDGIWSRKGEKITTVPFISGLCEIAEVCEIAFDGELYNHKLKDDFNRITSLVRREKVDDRHARDVYDIVQYHIYDIIAPWSFDLRHQYLHEIYRDCELKDNYPHVKLVTTKECQNQEELDDYYGHCLQQGYEGQMIRLNREYERKRSYYLLKRKKFQDEEFEIIGMVEGKGNRSGMVGAIIFETKNGKQFNAALMGTDEYRRRIWREHQKNSFEGVEATVKFFQYTPDGVPRFPVVKSINEGK